jgi:hypothetical protein
MDEVRSQESKEDAGSTDFEQFGIQISSRLQALGH